MPPHLGSVHGMPVARVVKLPERVACLTLDFEMDYGDRIGALNTLTQKDRIEELIALFQELEAPISVFIRTDLLDRFPHVLPMIRRIGRDFHCHSHTHATRGFRSDWEIETTASAFERWLGARPLGYRAPQGVLYPGDLERLKRHGFKVSSSVFPSLRPGKFNHLSMPVDPFIYANGIVELPFAAIPTVRYTLSLSYLKLLGWRATKALIKLWGLPSAVVLDSHLHDFIVSEDSFRQLPMALRCAWGVNKHAGLRYFRLFVEFLRSKGYRLITITELYTAVQQAVA